MKWTEDQEKAVYARPAQIVVSAAAGSGKTQVLSARIVERIKSDENPVSVDKLLIVTFTKAAASQMRERIGKALKEAIEAEKDDKKRRYLSQQLSLLAGAQICTIDSFCYNVVKQYFYEKDLPSDISMGETTDMALLKTEALEETIDSLYCAIEKKKGADLSEENEECAKLCEKYIDEDKLSAVLEGFEELTQTCSSDKKDTSFFMDSKSGDYTTMIFELNKKAQAAAYPEKWLDKIAESYNGADYRDTIFYKYPSEQLTDTLKGVLYSLDEAMKLSDALNIGYGKCLAENIVRLEKIKGEASYEKIQKALADPELFKKLSGKRRDCDKTAAEEIKAVYNCAKKSINDIKTLFEMPLEECERLSKLLYPQMLALCEAAKLLDKIYYEKMLDNHRIDFSACEHIALNIISPDGETLSEAGEALKNKYDEIYIDESQDSNKMQDLLFSLISNGNLFMVGDIKQSIYSFRNAAPMIFIKKCDESSFDENAARRKIFLSKNFRSRKCVIDAVNSIFDAVMTKDVCKIDYKKEHRLEFGADFITKLPCEEKCETDLVITGGNVNERAQAQAYHTAKKIAELVNGKKEIWDKDTGKMRPVRYSDITVLMRSPGKRAQIYCDVFSKFSIPVYYDGGESLFNTTEVNQIIEILKLIDNSKCDIPLACTMRSPMFLFDENEMLEIKMCGSGSFYEVFYGICDGKYTVSEALGKKCAALMRAIKKWRALSQFLSVEELLERIYTDTDIYTSALAFPDGEMRRANLDYLLEYAINYEKTNYNGLFSFINYVEKAKRTPHGSLDAHSVPDKMNAVTITSIHKSKGLEYPIVFLVQCEDELHGRDNLAGGLIINGEGYAAMNITDARLRCKYPSPMRNVLCHMLRCAEVAEEMRLLYVALTRAREKVYVVAAVSDYSKFKNAQMDILENVSCINVLSVKNYLELMALGIGHGADKYWSVTQYEADEEEESAYTKKGEICFEQDDETEKKLNFEYGYKEAVNLPGKTSVTRLKSMDLTLNEERVSPINTASQKNIQLKRIELLKKRERGEFYGTAHHKILQSIVFDVPVKEQKERLLDRGVLTKEEFYCISDKKIAAFMDSPIGTMMKNAARVYREEAFVMRVEAKENESIYVQGIIDCYFEQSDNSIVLVDYKTDTYKDPLDVAQKYKQQIEYYAMALKQKYKDRIIKKYLYLIHNNDIIEM